MISTAESRDRIVQEHWSLVERLARRKCHAEDFDDLVSVGLIGLLRAIDDYDSASTASFATFATARIRGAILHHIRDRSEMIRRPAWVWEARLPSIDVMSLDKHKTGGEGGDFYDEIEISDGTCDEDRVDKLLLGELVGGLPDKERRCVVGFYLEERTQTAIASDIGISANYVSHLLRRGIGRIQKQLFGGLGD